MTRTFGRIGIAFTAVAALITAASIAPAQGAPDGTALLGRMVSQSQSVQSYTASVRADIAMHSFPYLSPSLQGTYYHKEPSRNKIVFTSGLPFIAREFSKVYPQVESPSRWNEVYEVSTESDDGGFTTFKLVPRKHGRIDHIDAKVDDTSAEVTALRWNYNDGGYASLDQTYQAVSGHLLVSAQSGHIEVPHYNADMKSTFSDFKLNADIPDSVFTSD